MTTTELINLLKAHEFGGATGRPRNVYFEINGDCIETDGVEVIGSGDGLVTELLLSLPAAERWIPCSERLPDDISPVLITWINNNPEPYYQHIKGKPFVGVAHYCRGKWWWYSSVTEDYLEEYGRYDPEIVDEGIEVIAWMPLPEPYKGEQDG